MAFTGTEGASFLDIPVGGRPAAMGGGYSAEASDAYAPIYNPGGLGWLESTQLSGLHLSYLESINYEYATFVHPFGIGNAFGLAIQYFNPGRLAALDNNGEVTGDFGGHFGAYTFSYGRHAGRDWGLGGSLKWIEGRIGGTAAHTYAADLGALYRPNSRGSFSAVLSNAGHPLTFVDQADSLPLAFHVGAALTPNRFWNFALEGVYEKTGLLLGRIGLEWNPVAALSLRAGFRTDTIRAVSPQAGVTTGLGLHLFGQEFDYAWVPVGDLGSTHYFSIVLRFNETDRWNRNLIHYRDDRGEEGEPVYEPPLPDLGPQTK